GTGIRPLRLNFRNSGGSAGGFHRRPASGDGRAICCRGSSSLVHHRESCPVFQKKRVPTSLFVPAIPKKRLFSLLILSLLLIPLCACLSQKNGCCPYLSTINLAQRSAGIASASRPFSA